MIVVGRNDRVLRHHLHGLGRHGVHGMLQDVLHLLRVLLDVHLRDGIVEPEVVRVLDEGVVVVTKGGLLLDVLLLELRVLGLFFFDGIFYSGVVDGGLHRIDDSTGGGLCTVAFFIIIVHILLLLFFLRLVHLLAKALHLGVELVLPGLVDFHLQQLFVALGHPEETAF